MCALMPNVRALVLALLALVISVPSTAVWAASPVSENRGEPLAKPQSVVQFEDELGDFLRTWREAEETLGDRRLRRLAAARYHLRREDFGHPLDENPLAFDETTSVLRSSLSKLIRERLKDRILEEAIGPRGESRVDLPDSERDSIRLRISPRIALGGRKANVGARLRLSGSDDPIWSRFDLGFREMLERPGRSVYVQYRDHDRTVRLEHSFDSEAGDEIALTVRWLL